MTKVTFYDQPCGSGKSQGIINMVKQHPDKPFLIVLPTLDECARFREEIPRLAEPETSNKSDDLRYLLTDGVSVVCTHALFDITTPDHLALLVNYVVIIDEVLQVIEAVTQKGLTEEGWQRTYVANGYATVRDDGLVVPTDKWAAEQADVALIGSKTLYPLAKRGRLWKGSAGGFFVNEIPHEIFTVPAVVQVFTYLADYSLMRVYLERRGIDVEIVRDDQNDAAFRSMLERLLTIKGSTVLGKLGWGYSKQEARTDKQWDAVARALGSVRKNLFKGVDPKNILWSCVKAAKGKAGSRISRMGGAKWAAWNVKGTNDYRHCTHAVYLSDLYLHPSISGFYGTDQKFADGWAVSELIQWVFRTQLREGKPVELMLPAERMRGLLQRFLKHEL
jgi:hypothetical protein